MKRLPLKGSLLLSLVLHLILLFAIGLMAGRRTIQRPRLLIGVKLMEPGRGTEGHDSSAGGSKEALEHSLSSLTASMLEEGPVKDDASPDKPRKASMASYTGNGSAGGKKAPMESGAGTGSGTGIGVGSGDGNGDGRGGASGEGNDASRGATLTSYRKIYPQSARRAGETGSVDVGVAVSEEGSVTSAWVTASSGYERLDQAALDSAYTWHFDPALDAAGRPIAGETVIRVRYELN